MLLSYPPHQEGEARPPIEGETLTHPHTHMHGHYACPCTLRSGGLLHPTPIPLASFREGEVHAMTPLMPERHVPAEQTLPAEPSGVSNYQVLP